MGKVVRMRLNKGAPQNTEFAETKRGKRKRRRLNIMNMIVATQRAKQRVRSQEFSPFRLPEFPPNAKPPKGNGMAMDDVFGDGNQNDWSWANQSFLRGISSVYEEGLVFPGYPYLAELSQRGEYRVIAETIAEEATRKWIKFNSNDQEEDKTERVKELTDAFDKLQVRARFQKVSEIDNLFGRAHLYIDIRETDADEGTETTTADRDELKTSIGNGRNDISKSKIGKGFVKRLKVVEPVWTYPTSYNANDPLSDHWYEPVMWYVMGKEIHHTRLLKFVAREVPDMLKPAYAFGGQSTSQIAKPYVDNWLKIRQSVADIVQAFSIFVLETDLSEVLSESSDELFERIEMFNAIRNNKGLMVINKDVEAFQNVAAPLGTLDSIQAQAQEHMAAISRIPIVKLLGIQPAGLNASSDGEIRTFYDHIHAYQERFYRPNLTIVADMVMLSLWGEVDKSISFEFLQLAELDEAASATKRKTDMDTDVEAINAGVISAEESRRRVASDPNTPYQSLDVNDMPEPPQQPGMEGMEDGEQGPEPGGGGGAPQGTPGGELGRGNGPGGAGREGAGGSAPEGGGKEPTEQRGEQGVRGQGNGEAGGLRDVGPENEGVEEDVEPPKIKQSERNRLTAGAALVRQQRRALKNGEDRRGSFVGDEMPISWSVSGLCLALDKAWNEGEHPRDADGKFASYSVAPGLAGKAKKLGFTNLSHSDSGKLKLEHEAGHVLVVEPPGEAGGQSQVYSFYPADGSKPIKGQLTGQHAKSFYDKVGAILQTSQQYSEMKKSGEVTPEGFKHSGPTPGELEAATKAKSNLSPENVAGMGGFKYQKDWTGGEGWTYKDNKNILDIAKTGEWSIWDPSSGSVKGEGKNLQELQEHFGGKPKSAGNMFSDMSDEDFKAWEEMQIEQESEKAAEGGQHPNSGLTVADLKAHYEDGLITYEEYIGKLKEIAGAKPEQTSEEFIKEQQWAASEQAFKEAPTAQSMVNYLSDQGLKPLAKTEHVQVFTGPNGEHVRVGKNGNWFAIDTNGKEIAKGFGLSTLSEQYGKPPAEEPASTQDFLSQQGWEVKDKWGGGTGYHKDNMILNVWKDGKWKISQQGKKPITGTDPASMKAHMGGAKVAPTPASPKAQQADLTKHLVEQGFAWEGDWAAEPVTLRRGDVKVNITKNGDWSTPDGKFSGSSVEGLQSFLGKNKTALGKGKPPTPTQQEKSKENLAKAQPGLTNEQKAAAAQHSVMKNKMYGALQDKGYGHAPNDALEKLGVIGFKKDDASVKVASNGDWIAESPGFSSKAGSGKENLDAFLSGEKAFGTKWNKGEITNWLDEHDPDKAAKLEEKKKKQAAEQATQAKAQAEKDAVKSKMWGNLKSWEKSSPTPTATEKASISSYTGSGYHQMNGNLRAGGKASKGSEDLKSYLDKSSFPEDTVLYRGVNGDFANHLKSVLLKGSVFQDKGFTSSTVNPDMGFVSNAAMRMKVHVRKGSKGAAVSHLTSASYSEGEIIFQAGSQFKVLSLPKGGTKSGESQWIEVELMLPEEHYAADVKRQGIPRYVMGSSK